MNTHYHTPDLTRRVFARTNCQTIDQRAAILRELLPSVSSIADICCGDCTRQREIYLQTLNLESYRGLDICPEIVEANQAKGVAGDGEITEPRLKYVELWLSCRLTDLWEVRKSVMEEKNSA